MGGESDNFLPPWLRGADEPDNDPESGWEYVPDEPDEEADPATVESADAVMPPWLRDEEPTPEPDSFAQTMGLPKEFLDSADTLPETAHGDLSYDEWLHIQQEATREHSVEEEIPDLLSPDLLSEDTSSASPFFDGTVTPAATGELPDWFLGLEELDESQAPDWFVAQGGEASPSSSAVEAALSGLTGSEEVLSDEDEWDLPIDPDDVGDVSLDSFVGATGSGASAFTDSASDDPMESFFAGVSRQRHGVRAQDENAVSDWDAAPEAEPSLPDDDFYAAYASLDAEPDEQAEVDHSRQRAAFHEDQFVSDSQFEESLLDTNPTPDSVEVSSALHSAHYDEPDLSAFADVEFDDEPVSAAPVQDIEDENLDSESLNWLSEVSSMVNSVTRDPDEFAMGFDEFPAAEDGGETEQPYFFPDAEPEPETQTPDWLTELQADEPDQPIADNAVRPRTAPPKPVIDFSTMDFDEFKAEEESYAETSAAPDDTYDDLFANLQRQPGDPAQTPENTSGATVILSPDTLPPQSEDIEEPKITNYAAPEERRAYVTDELDAMLFGEDMSSLDSASAHVDQTYDAGSRSEIDDDYRILEQLSGASSTGSQSRIQPAEEDLAWLRNVSFDDESSDSEAGGTAFAPVGAEETHAASELPHATVDEVIASSVEDFDAQIENAVDFGDLDVASNTVNAEAASGEMDDLRSLLDNLGDAGGDDPDAAFDAMFSDVEAEPIGDAPDSGLHVRVQTAELNALFGDTESSEEETFPGSEDVPALEELPPQSAMMTGTPAHDAREQVSTQPEQLMPQNDDFDSIFGGMNEPPEDESESLPDGGLNADDDGEDVEFASNDDDLDELFASLDASLDYPPGELPSTAPLSENDDVQGQGERIAADEDDLEALFAAFEDEHRDESSGQPAEAEGSLDFPDDDSFFAAMGLGDEPESPERFLQPEDEAQPPPDEEEDDTTGPDLDFLEGFGQPEMNKSTVISGEENTSMWEEPETTEEQPEVELLAVPAFAFDDSGLPVETDSQDDWFHEPPIDDFAPEPGNADEYDDLSSYGTSEAQAIEDVPGWLQDIDTSSMSASADETASEAAAALFGDDAVMDNLEDFIARLDEPEAILPQRNEYAEPGSDEDDFDLEAVFDQALSDIADNEATPETSGLEQSDMLDELQASVGAVSAAALARQMEDRPESELSARLQKLRKRSTDEMRAAQTGAQEEGDNLSKVLPGVDDALVPVPVATEPGEFFGGVILSDQQRAQVALLGELIGGGDEPIQMRGSNRLSAIDLTYEGMHLQDEDAAVEGERVVTKAEAPARARVRRRRTYRIDRLLLTLLLAAGIILPFFVKDFRIGALPPPQFALGSQESHAFDQIDKLEQYDLVMVGLEYGPASAGELDQLADSIVRHVLLRGARPIFVSGNAFGVLRAEYFLDAVNADRAFLERINQRVPMEANVEYYTARFLPGGAVGLRAFSEATSGLLTYDINGQTQSLNLESLSNLALIIMVTDRAEDVRAYAEQIAPLASRPLVVGVSYAAAPLAEPYAHNENAVRGLLVGYEDAYTYHTLLDTVDAVSRGVRPVRPTIIAPTPAAPEETQVEGQATGEPPLSATSEPGVEATPLAAPSEVPEAEALPSAIVISANGANLRSGPGTDFRVVAGMARNTLVTVLAYNDTGDWVNVRLDDGTEGWVSSGLIVIVEETPAPDDSSSGKRISSRPPMQDDPDPTATVTADNDPTEPDRMTLQWYGMNTGIVGAFLVISFGALTGILRAIFVRRKTS